MTLSPTCERKATPWRLDSKMCEMQCSRKKEIKKGNLVVRLDRDEVFPDDPGQGTPAIVEWNGADGQFTATYWCAMGEGELLNSRGHVKKLTDAQLEWLDGLNQEIDEFLQA